MQLTLSNLAFSGFQYHALKNRPSSIGLEVFYEFGDSFYWNAVMAELYGTHPPRQFSVHGPCIGTDLAAEKATNYLAVYESAFQFAAKWQADFLVVHTNETAPDDYLAARARVEERLAKLASLSQEYQVQLVIENVGLITKGNLLYDWSDYQDLLAKFPTAGALLDTGHGHINNWNLPEVIKILTPRLTACHLHDNHAHSDDHLPIGHGTIEWSSVFTALETYAPETTLVFEYANVTLSTALDNIHSTCTSYLQI